MRIATPAERLKRIEDDYGFQTGGPENDTIQWLIARVKLLTGELDEANDLLRSALSIAERKGSATNWDGFIMGLKNILRRQHEILGGDNE